MSRPAHERSLAPTGFVSLAADMLTVTVAEALPPGTRVRLRGGAETLDAAGGAGGKVVSIERAARGGYAIAIRLTGVTRAEREALAARCAGGD